MAARVSRRATTYAGLLRFLAELKAGEPKVRAPVYSHLTYDIVDDEEIVLRSPDIVIVEGVNVLQTPARRGAPEASVVVSDFFDFSIYVDAAEDGHRAWYIDRLLLLRETSLHDPRSFFHFLTQYTEDDDARVRPQRSGTRSTSSTCARTSRRRAGARTSCSRRAATTRCTGSGCASS